jgi:hypothetical protein
LWTVDAVREEFREAILSGRKDREKMTNVAQTRVRRMSEPVRLAQRGVISPIQSLNGLVAPSKVANDAARASQVRQ